MKQSALADLKVVLDQLIGNDNVLSNNILFIDFTGSHEKAQLLSQMWYWSGKTKEKHGWFFKTYQEWFDEIRVPEHSVRRFVDAFKKAGFVATCFKKVAGRPVVHYRLDKDVLIQKLVTFCEGNNLLGSHSVTLDPDNLQPTKEGDNLQASLYTETTLRDLNTESDAPAQFIVQTIALETIPTVECEVPPVTPAPYWMDGNPDWMEVAQLMEAHAKGEGKAQWEFMCKAQGYTGEILPIVSNWASKAHRYQLMRWKDEFRKLQTWLKTESRADYKAAQRNGTQPTAPAAPVQIRREI